MADHILQKLPSKQIISERVTNLNKEYADLVHCPICNCILWKPVTCSKCENAFCSDCIQTWVVEQQNILRDQSHNQNGDTNNSSAMIRCPFNCSPYTGRKCSPLLISILSKLKIECRNKSHGCQETLLYEEIEKHELDLCPYSIIRCERCEQDMFKHVFDKDEHQSTCLYIQFECLKCLGIFQKIDQHSPFNCVENQMDSLKQYIAALEKKHSQMLDSQRSKLDILDKKLAVIGAIWDNDDSTDENQFDKKNISCNLSSFLFTQKCLAILGIKFITLIMFVLFSVVLLFHS